MTDSDSDDFGRGVASISSAGQDISGSSYSHTEEALEQAGCNFTVDLVPAAALLQGGYNEDAQIVVSDDKKCTIRHDNGNILGFVGLNYNVVQNRDSLSLLDPLVDEYDLQYTRVGTIGDGEIVWTQLQFPDSINVADVNIDRNILLRTSHDGSYTIQAAFTPVVVQCQNMLNIAFGSASWSFSIRHTKSADRKLKKAEEAMEQCLGFYDELEFQLDLWMNTPIDNDTIRDIGEELFGGDEERSTLADNQYQEFVECVIDPTGVNAQVQNTKFAAIMGVSEYADHKKTFRASKYDPKESRLRSTLDGSAQRFKQKGSELVARA